jgi:hypothetical protein
MLFETYTGLVRNFPPQREGLFGQGLNDESGLWLAVDAHGYPSFLLAAQPTDARSDIELRFVGVRFSCKCEIVVENGDIVCGTYTIVRLEENDPDIVRLFLRLLEEAFCGDNAPRTNRAIGERILELANLFRQVENSQKDIIGLWGELQVIWAASSREAAARCWCQHQNAKYDFVCDGFAIEVKATLKPNRTHRFSLDQLRPSSDLTVFIASAQLVQAQGGRAVFELIDDILDSIGGADLRKAFLSSCLIKGGEDIYKSTVRFQFLARDIGIVYFAAADIPVPTVDHAAPISNVKFDVCLGALPEKAGDERARLVNMTYATA